MASSFRSPWSFFVWLLGAAFLLIGVATLDPDRLTANIFTTSMAFGFGGWVFCMAPLSRVRVDGKAIRYFGVFKWKTFAWSGVEELSTIALGGDLMGSEAPVIRTVEGKEFPLLILAGYTGSKSGVNSRVQRQVEVMRNGKPVA
ncbi:hypothetical protein [Streptomyces sp. NBC_00045]|uniref:hypothetical protein n=1 Tax=Streptomyces sp. NBC_00045 TaxID=2975625 RepID=UPI002F90D18B